MVEAMDPAQAFEAKLLTRNKAMNEATERGDSAVQQFYCGAAVFVTGGSGFLGKQLIEKLFRATKISKIFILLRSKKGKTIQQRLNEMLEDPLYDMLKGQQPNFADRIVPIAGDVAELRLGISEKDWKMITEQVDIIFHLAATTRFDECLQVATLINVRGAREALMLGKDCKKLKSYVHVSTAYSHARENLIHSKVLEDFYQSPVDPETMIKLAETVDEWRINDIAPSFTQNWPNTYSFTKAVSEEAVRSLSEDLPICIVRPAVVICAQKEPNPGWVDISNVYGASGIIFGSGLGVMHAMSGSDETKIGFIPVDIVNNAIIAAAWETAKRKAAGEIKPKIYTLTTSTRNPVALGNVVSIIENIARKNYPPPLAVGYNSLWNVKSPAIFWIVSWLMHFIPAYVIDGICLVLGKERRFVKLSTKMYKMSLALSYFTLNYWQFVDTNTATLYDNLSTEDQEIFDFDVTKINWEEYLCLWVIGVRKYIMKDGLKGTNYALKKQFVFKILTFIITPLYLFLLFKILSFTLMTLCLFLRSFLSLMSFFE